MIRKIRYMVLGLMLLVQSQQSTAQEMMHLQSVVKQEFINPAYNSFKDYISINLISRLQWVSLPYHPEVFGTNVYIPFRFKRLGLNATLMRENIGLRKINSLDLSLSSNVKVSPKGFLAFGYGIGIKSTSYRTEDIITSYDDEYLLDHEIWGTDRFTTKLGAFYMNDFMFAGLSANMLVDKTWNEELVIYPSWDLILGAMYQINRDVLFRPDLVVKYYRGATQQVNEGEVSNGYAAPVFDLAVNFLFKDRIWAGLSYRLNMALTTSLSLKVNKNLMVGYTYEYGVGKGVNQFSSHGLSLSYSFSQKAVLYNYQRKAAVRHRIGEVVNRNNLYR
ncbi:PorP/SprF family type IX secretion system membrane protein [Sunxiuqinia rutila]|uniref:PorP/SprF family type IX secretion system membrane protein n=1 Tax=Sunxiuqinia rutila TaxID=1397841 RepID=UPI003D368CFC